MVLANKYLLTIWQFDFIIFLILIEMLINIFIIGVLNLKLGKALFEFKFDKRMKNLIIAAFFYSMHSVLSLKALNGLNVPIYTVFKRYVPSKKFIPI
jgi:solute carrier family 35 protein